MEQWGKSPATVRYVGETIQRTQTIKRIYTPQHIFPKQIWLGWVEYE